MNAKLRKRLLTWAAATAVLLGVFAAYLQPDAVMTLANQIWLCI